MCIRDSIYILGHALSFSTLASQWIVLNQGEQLERQTQENTTPFYLLSLSSITLIYSYLLVSTYVYIYKYKDLDIFRLFAAV